MAQTSGGFRWNYDAIRPSLLSSREKAKNYLSRITTYHALRGEAAMRVGATWVDRTGNARGGLTGLANNSRASAGHHEIEFFGKMTYNWWLEVRFAGRYAIVAPTIKSEGAAYFKTATEVLEKMFGK